MGNGKKIIVKFAKDANTLYSKKDYSNSDATEKVIKYIFKMDRRQSYDIYGAMGTSSRNISEIIDDFELVRRTYGKNYGCQVKHLIISFPQLVDISEKKMIKLVMKTVRYWSRRYQLAYAVHSNTSHIHIHIVLNAVANNGKRINIRNKDLSEFRLYCNDVWEKYLM